MIGAGVSVQLEGVPQVSEIDQPWTRVRIPVLVPSPVDAAGLLALDDRGFADLIRSNLMPRDDVPGGRARWSEMWGGLMDDDDLSERTFDVLEDFLDATEAAIAAGELEGAEAGRARKFKVHCEGAWERLQRSDDDQPLAWAGEAASGFNAASRWVIARLISAIAKHRSAVLRSGRPVTPQDQHLWDVMHAVQLDPRDYHYRGRD